MAYVGQKRIAAESCCAGASLVGTGVASSDCIIVSHKTHRIRQEFLVTGDHIDLSRLGLSAKQHTAEVIYRV